MLEASRQSSMALAVMDWQSSASLSVFIIMRGFNIIHYSSLTLTICRILFAFWDRLLHKIVQVKFGACYYKIESRKQKGVLCLFESWRSQAKEEITSWKSFMKKRLVSILTTSEEASTLLAVWLRAVWQLLYIFGGNICLAHARIGQGHHKSVSWDFCSILHAVHSSEIRDLCLMIKCIAWRNPNCFFCFSFRDILYTYLNAQTRAFIKYLHT